VRIVGIGLSRLPGAGAAARLLDLDLADGCSRGPSSVEELPQGHLGPAVLDAALVAQSVAEGRQLVSAERSEVRNDYPVAELTGVQQIFLLRKYFGIRKIERCGDGLERLAHHRGGLRFPEEQEQVEPARLGANRYQGITGAPYSGYQFHGVDLVVVNVDATHAARAIAKDKHEAERPASIEVRRIQRERDRLPERSSRRFDRPLLFRLVPNGHPVGAVVVRAAGEQRGEGSHSVAWNVGISLRAVLSIHKRVGTHRRLPPVVRAWDSIRRRVASYSGVCFAPALRDARRISFHCSSVNHTEWSRNLHSIMIFPFSRQYWIIRGRSS
jgi:hypothetical protein